MKKVFFSIITTTFNRVESGYLEQNIVSLQGQHGSDLFNYEHIIVDDGSSDNTAEFVESFANSDKRIKYIHQDNAGPARATKTGIANASGDFVVIVDDDDYLTPNSLQLRAKAILKSPDTDFFYGVADWVDEYSLPITPLFQSRHHENFLYERMLISNCINAGTPTTRRTLLEGIAQPEWLNRSQDYFLWLEILRPERNIRYQFMDDVLVNYRYHSNGYTAGLDDESKREQKALLNQKIKDLHDPSLSFLASEAQKWVNEAHMSNRYRLDQLRDKDARIDEIQQALDSFAHSRVVRYTVKARNVIRGQVFDRINRSMTAVRRGKSKVYSSKPISYKKVNNEAWDSKRPLVTVVTPFYNRQDTMPETVRSVLGQTFQDFEYIVVNDGSPDVLANEYIDKLIHPKITVINQINSGVAAARNKGIESAQGKYIICLDSDDVLEPTYLEKAVTILETNHNVSIVSYDMQMFGVKDEVFRHDDYDPIALIDDNPVLTAAVFRSEVWHDTDGYKSGIGYEDWEFWVNAAEKGHFGIHIPEILFRYRTAEVSRYVDDLSNHHSHAGYIQEMHPNFKQEVEKHLDRRSVVKVVETSSSLININRSDQYIKTSQKKQVLVAVPWMTFGGAETLIYNYCKEVEADVDLTFVTGIKSPNEWEYKFRELSPRIYHLANMFDDERMYFEYISNLIETRNIDTLHIVHSGYVFPMLQELKERHAGLKVIVTLFNDRAAYFDQAVDSAKYIDIFTADNNAVSEHYRRRAAEVSDIRVIPNGIDAESVYNPALYDREANRLELGVKPDELAVFFIGRLSEEKNPDKYIEAAGQAIEKYAKLKFFIIGDGIERTRVEKLIGLMSTDRIEYLGYKSSVVEYLSAADIFILPSSIEGFPLSILEAMSMGVVPVASDVGAIPDVIENGVDGFIIEPGSVGGIMTVLGDIHSGNRLRDMGVDARKKVLDNYSTDQLGHNYRDLYGVKL